MVLGQPAGRRQGAAWTEKQRSCTRELIITSVVSWEHVGQEACRG